MVTERVQDVDVVAGHSPQQERPLGAYAVLMFGSDLLQVAYKKAEDAL